MSSEITLSGNSIEAVADTAGDLAVVTREQTEIQSAIIAAKRFRRNEQECFVRAIKAFQRPTMADAAIYSFPRGGKAVEGPSVGCARELARIWGNIRYGLRVVSNNGDRLHIKAFALDLETNTYVEAEDEFSKLIQRKNKYTGEPQWIQPDERDLRELMNRRGAIAIRNSILQLLPSDLIDDVLKTARHTLQKDASQSLEQNREEVVKRLVVSFDRVGVSVSMLETFLKHKLDVITAEEVAALRQIHQSLTEGVAKREEFFKFDGASAQEESSATSAIKAKLREKSGASNGPKEVNL